MHHHQPELLQQLYDRIEPLGVYLQRVLRPATSLLQASDLQDYRHVLERCLVAQPGSSIAARRRDGSPRSPASAPRLASSQPEVVRQVIETLFRESASPEHVLALGNCRPRFGGMGSNAFHGVEQLIPSSAAAALQTRPWATLLQRIGDAAMMTLLLDCALFLPTLGSTLLQLSGAPVNKLVHQLRAPAPTQRRLPDSSGQPPSPPYKRPADMAFVSLPCDVSGVLTAVGRRCVHQRPAGSGHVSEEPQTGPTPPPSQCTPSFSQRVTPDISGSEIECMMAAAIDTKLSTATQPEPTPTLSLPPKYCEASATNRSVLAAASPSSTCLLQAQRQHPQPQHPKEAFPSGLEGGDKSGASTSAAGAAKLNRSTPPQCVRNRLMISRRKLFYNFHFSKMVGLPNDHSLATCGATINGARRLFHQVFTHGRERGGNGWHSTQQQQQQQQQQNDNNVEEAHSAESIPRLRRRHRKSCAAASGTASRQRIDKLCRPLIPLLLEVIQRHQRAPYARILEHHCPLPPELSKRSTRAEATQRSGVGLVTAAENQQQQSSKVGGDGGGGGDGTVAENSTASGKGVLRVSSNAAADPHAPPDKALSSPETQPMLPASLSLPPLSEAAASFAAAQQTPDIPAAQAPTATGLHCKQGSLASVATETAQVKTSGTTDDVHEHDVLDPEASVIRLHSPHYAVAGFVKTSLRFLIPVELWGGEENMRRCFKHIDRFVRLRRFENFSLKEATHGLKSTQFPPDATRTQVSNSKHRENTLSHNHQNQSETRWSGTKAAYHQTERRREHPNRLALRQRLLADWIYWIFTQLVVPLIRTGFYATECEGFRNRVFFFRKPVWAVVRKTTLRKLNQDMFQPLTEAEAALVVSRRDFGFAGLRMLPKKEKGVRLITNMSRRTRSKAVRIKGKAKSKKLTEHPDKTTSVAADADVEISGEVGAGCERPAKVDRAQSSDKGIDTDGSAAGTGISNVNAVAKPPNSANVHYKRDRPRSINDALTDAFLVLKYEKLNNPACWGASVFGLHDIYKKLLPFVQLWRHGEYDNRCAPQERQQCPHRPLPLYFATIDIRHCYDTIPHQVLCDRVLPLVLREPAYVCGRYARVSHRPPRPDEKPVAEVSEQSGESLHVRYLHCAFPLKDLDRLVQRSRGGESELVLQPWRKRCTVLVNQESQSVIDRETILATIREHVTQNIIKVDGRYLRTKTGIPQGSVLSVLLCGLFYAHLENHLLRPVVPLGPLRRPRLQHLDNFDSGQLRPGAIRPAATVKVVAENARPYNQCNQSGYFDTGKRRRTSSRSAEQRSANSNTSHAKQSQISTENPSLAPPSAPWHEASTGDRSTDVLEDLKSQDLVKSPLSLAQPVSQPLSILQSQSLQAADSEVGAGTGTVEHDTGLRQELYMDFVPEDTGMIESGSISDAESDATVECDSSDVEELLRAAPEPFSRTAAAAMESDTFDAETTAVPTPDHLPAAPGFHSARRGQHSNADNHCSLLLRLVDDFLYITTDLSAARRFVNTLHGHIPDYGCTVHQAKTQTSFSMSRHVGSSHSVQTERMSSDCNKNGSGFIPWCGLLLKTSTLEVQADYSRYLGKDFRLRDSFTVEASRVVGSTLRRRLYSFLRPKCHGVLLDTRINSLPTVWLNIYQAFLLAAIKFHCYTRALPQRHLNVQFFTRCVLHAVQAMRSLIRRRISAVSAECAVTATEVHWLGLRAFQHVLRRKHAFYKPLLPVLERLLNRPAYQALEQRLGPTTEPHRSPEFQKMIY